jgi:CheY-like chemotaxis protein
VLVVDDDREIRWLLTMFIGKLDYDVAQAPNGAEALSMFQAHPFDLVISDIQMPEMDGHRLMRELKALSPGIPVVLITGKPLDEGAIGGAETAAETVLSKPFPLDALKAVMDRIFQE